MQLVGIYDPDLNGLLFLPEMHLCDDSAISFKLITVKRHHNVYPV